MVEDGGDFAFLFGIFLYKQGQLFVSLSTSNQHIVAEATQKKRIHGREVRRIWQQMAGFCRNGISKEVHEKKTEQKGNNEGWPND